jgi:hypothetical protein
MSRNEIAPSGAIVLGLPSSAPPLNLASERRWLRFASTVSCPGQRQLQKASNDNYHDNYYDNYHDNYYDKNTYEVEGTDSQVIAEKRGANLGHPSDSLIRTE